MNRLFGSRTMLMSSVLVICLLLCACGARSQPVGEDADLDGENDADESAPQDADRDADPDVEADADEEDTICDDSGIPQIDGLCVGDDFCWQRPTPFGVNLSGVWGSSPNDVWAVGSRGTIAHFDGTEWNLVESPTLSNIHDVWVFSNDDVWIVGRQGEAFHFDGTDWSQLDPSLFESEDLYAVWGSATDDLWFAGLRGLFHSQGDEKVEQYFDPMLFVKLCGSGTNNVWSFYLTQAYHWNGIEWEINESTLNPFGWDEIYSIWTSGPEDFWFTSNRGVYHFDGERWTNPITREELGWQDPRTIVGTSSEDIWFLGSHHAFHFDGSEFSEVPSLGIEILRDSWMDASGNHGWAVGPAGRLVRFVDGEWTPYGGFSMNRECEPLRFHDLTDVFALDDNNAWAVGEQTILRFDGETWAFMPEVPPGHWESVWASAPDDLWIMNDEGHIYRWNEEEWSWFNRESDYLLGDDIWGASPDDVWFVADSSIFHWDGSDLSFVYDLGLLRKYPDRSYRFRFDGTGPNNIWLVAGENLYYYNGKQWNRLPDNSSLITDVRAFGHNNVWLAHDDGWIRVWDGSTWTNPAQIDFIGEDRDDTYITALFGPSPDDLWAMTRSGEAYHFDGTNWTLSALMSVDINYASQTPSGTIFAVGENGSILRRLP